MTSSPKLELSSDEIHLWFAIPEEIQASELLDTYYHLMNEEEKEKQGRFHFEKHRHQYLVTRAVVRSVLSRYSTIEPEAWEFEKNHYGKPEIASFIKGPNLRFNLSHTEGMVVCGVTLQKDLGVDVENLERKSDTLGIATRFFSAREANDLQQLGLEQQKTGFFDYWTLKESYIKAVGKGLAIPLEQFSFGLHKDQPISISFADELKDDPESWTFRIIQPSNRYKVSIAIRSNPVSHPYRLTMMKTIPLFSENPVSYPVIKIS